MPVDPPPTPWVFPPAHTADTHGIVGVGADLEPGTLLAAYRQGLFPMPLGADGELAWWSPDPRGVLDFDDLHVSRSLRRSMRHFEASVDQAFDEVVAGCADPSRPHGWIDARIRTAYGELHRLGWAHSIEIWADDTLIGGLYGVAIGGFFAGESMFHRRTDASKAAVVHLVELLGPEGAGWFDVQWTTPHLASLGCHDISRRQYLARLRAALALPLPTVFTRPS